jgi:CarD family transcriptional regulator
MGQAKGPSTISPEDGIGAFLPGPVARPVSKAGANWEYAGMSSIKKTNKKQRVRQVSRKTGSKKAVRAKRSSSKIIAAAAALSIGMTKKSPPSRSAGKSASKSSADKLRRIKAKAAADAERAAKEKLQRARAAKVRAAEAKRSAVVNTPARSAAGKTQAPQKLVAKAAKGSSTQKMSAKSKIADNASLKADNFTGKEDKKQVKAVNKTAAKKTLPAAAKLKDGQPGVHGIKGGAPAKSPAKPAQGQFQEASDRNKVKNTKMTAAPAAAPAEKAATPPSAANDTELKKGSGGRTPSEKLAAVRAAAAKSAASKAALAEPAKLGTAPPRSAPAASVKSAAPPPAPPALTPAVPPALAAAPAKPTAKPGPHKHGFKTNEFIVYPSHGVGQILAIEEQEVAGFRLELFIITFVKDKLTLKVPLPKVTSVGMRKLAEPEIVTKALDTLTGRARIKRTMWSRRAQEYEAKINSGDLVAIAEVVRDLYRSDAQPEQSYSERQLYEAALDRMAREIAAVQRLTETESLKLIEGNLQKGPRRGAKADVEADSDPDGTGDIEEAA